MNKVITALLSSTLILTATAKEASTNMQPGLWEITTTSDLLQLAQHIPPDQLKGIAKIAKEYGLEMPKLDNGAAISETCITASMAQQQMLPQLYQEELGCETNRIQRNGNEYQASFSCDSAELKGQGTIKGKLTSTIHFVGTSHFKGVAQGIPINEAASIEGKWLNASCNKQN